MSDVQDIASQLDTAGLNSGFICLVQAKGSSWLLATRSVLSQENAMGWISDHCAAG